jgi:hypothetical protein
MTDPQNSLTRKRSLVKIQYGTLFSNVRLLVPVDGFGTIVVLWPTRSAISSMGT